MSSETASTRPNAPPRSGSNNYLQALASAQNPTLSAAAPRPSSLRHSERAAEDGSSNGSTLKTPPKTPTESSLNTGPLSPLPSHLLGPPTTGTGAPPPTPISGTGVGQTSPFGETGTRVVQSGPGKEDVGEGKSWDEQDMKRVVQRRLLNVEKSREAGFSSTGGEGGRNP